jgi:ketosteroid isomerase-like protein
MSPWSPHFPMNKPAHSLLSLVAGCALAAAARGATPADDAAAVAAQDTRFQAAVKANDADTIADILAADHILVTGRGHTFNKADEIQDARGKSTLYEHQEEEAGTQKVRVYGDTAVVTALLWIKGAQDGKAIEYRLWFSDMYVRTPGGWKYAFGQASLPLPKA